MDAANPQRSLGRPARCAGAGYSRLIYKEVEMITETEAARGVVSVLDEFGLDSRAQNLKEARDFFNSRNLLDQVDWVLETARVSDVVMANDPLDEIEAEIWRNGGNPDRRFHTSLRLDSLLNEWPDAARILASQGLHVNTGLSGSTIAELRRFLDNWIKRMRPLYLAISLPADFKFPDEN